MANSTNIYDYPKGTERYRVSGYGAIIVTLNKNDVVTLIDPEGKQAAELLIFDKRGNDLSNVKTVFNTLLSETSFDCSPISTNFLTILKTDDRRSLTEDIKIDLERIHSSLRQHHIDLFKKNDLKTLKLLNGNSMNSKEQFQINTDESLIAIIGCPGTEMIDHEENILPATEVLVFIQRSDYREQHSTLPPPILGCNIRLDLRIQSSTAQSYEIKAGEYIQIIDVDGKQCSDFLAFNNNNKDGEEEYGLDVTTTRTLNGIANPKPGVLYSKFFDSKMIPLVEIIQDTVGRHDTFGLACASKYYDDQGYFGHLNCTDNFNMQLKQYYPRIKPRSGWPAINFFYNTAFDRSMVLYLDEPWSRPGDYVLLRALTNIICASSACPDDIDAANGWNPTDIHVRVYDTTITPISKGIAYRITSDSVPRLTRETSFHPCTSQLTQTFVDYRNYWLATEYRNYGILDEYWGCREHVSIMDLSPLRKFEILGPDSENLLQITLTRSIKKMSIGQITYTAICSDTAGMIDDGTLFKLNQDRYRLVCGSDYTGIWLREQAHKLELHRVWIKTSTDQIHNVSIQGPKSRDLLKSLNIRTTSQRPTISELKWFRFTIGKMDNLDGTCEIPLLISRTGYTGELGYEIWCHPSNSVKLWEKIWLNGQNPMFNLKPLGLLALDILRIEAGLIFFEYEFDEQTDPIEAGIEFAIDFAKQENFIGKQTLIKRKEYQRQKLVGLELHCNGGSEIGSHGDCVHLENSRQQIGIVTSGCKSPILNKSIALARISAEHSQVGNRVEIGKLDGYQKRIKATIVKYPFYDPEKTKLRS